MHKAPRRKRLSKRPGSRKIVGMKRSPSKTDAPKFIRDSRDLKLAEESRAMWARREEDLRNHPEKFRPDSPQDTGLKRGPKRDSSRGADDKCTRTASTVLTPREWRIVEKMRNAYPFPPTPSQFLRSLICGSLGKKVPLLPEKEYESLMRDAEVLGFQLEDWGE